MELDISDAFKLRTFAIVGIFELSVVNIRQDWRFVVFFTHSAFFKAQR
jgi:hypothetical protein